MKYAAFIVAISCFSSVAFGDNWPQWRGPHDTSVAEAGNYPTQFSADENVRWKVELPGRGSSTPAVWGDRIVVTCPIEGDDGVVCYDFAGKEQWRETFGPAKEGKHRNGSGSNPSPVSDGKHLIVYFKSGTIACLSLDGQVAWQKNLQDEYGKDTLWWDLGTSPILAAGNVVVAVMQAGDSYLVALDLETGDAVWKQPRMFECQEESDQAYTTPHVLEVDGRQVIVTWGADHLTGHEAATGKLLWTCGGFNPNNQGMWRVIASAAVDGEVAVVPYGRATFLAAIDLTDASGDITESHRLWERGQIGSDVPTPVINGEMVILLGDKGDLHCLNKRSGDDLWSHRLPRARDKYYSSPILAGNLLYCAREDGVVMTCELGDSGVENVYENDMGESVVATPVVLRDLLIVRGEKHLFLISR